MEKSKRGSFTGSLGFILAAAGSAVGLGNLWRFPILAAKDGGGIFLVVYIILALTFGFALMTTEIAIGRKTGRSAISAFSMIDKRFGWVGWIAGFVPVLIFPYYCVIGGWVFKYTQVYVTDLFTGVHGTAVDATGGFFTGFITHQWAPIFWFLLFLGITAVFVFLGVDKGVEKISKILMPILALLIVGIAIFSLTLKDTESGRTAIDGLKIYVIPNFEGMTVSKFLTVVLDAMGQMFFSMSLAMGIMITYGSYARKDSNLVTSVNRIEIFDTGVALLAGLIMIPSVYCFLGTEGLAKAGPSLMFISLPQVFDQMGPVLGTIIGVLFFVLVIFAAITSSISLMETIASMIMDRFKLQRKTACTIILIASAIIGVIVCLGYNIFYFEADLPNGAKGQQLLDIMDWIANNFLMPIVAILTCVMIGWFAKPKTVIDEVKLGNLAFNREKLYIVMVKYVAPILLFTILLQSFGVFNFLG